LSSHWNPAIRSETDMARKLALDPPLKDCSNPIM